MEYERVITCSMRSAGTQLTMERTMTPAFYNFSVTPVGLTGAAAPQYVSDVPEHLRWIYRTTSGRILLNVIRRPSFPVEIRPYTGTDCNAVGGGENKTPTSAL